MTTNANLNKRWLYLVSGVFTMLFSGVLYAWSILKIPFKNEFEWSDSILAFNFTLTMCFFCLGAFFGSLICKKVGTKLTLILAGALVGAGFVTTGLLNAQNPYLLYLTYAVLAGTGIGISYNVVVSTVNSWFPDKKGFSSGCLMMGFGVSTLLLGNVISSLFENENFGWSKAYIILGIIVAVVLVLAGLILKKPSPDVEFPAPKTKKVAQKVAPAVKNAVKKVAEKVTTPATTTTPVTTVTPVTVTPEDPTNNKNWVPWAIGGAVAVGAIILLSNKKKKRA